MADTLDRTEAVADAAIRQRLEHPARRIDVRRQYFDTTTPRLFDEVDYLFGAVHVAGHHRGHEFGRVVRLQPGGLVGDKRIGGGVRLVEAVLGELFHQVEDRRGELRVDVVLFRTGLELDALLGHLLGLLLAHGATQQVGAAEAVATHDLGDLHHLLLVHDHAVGRLQDRFQQRVRIADFGAAMTTVDEVVDHAGVERAGTVQRGQCDQVLEHRRLQLSDVVLHAARLELEHRRGFATREKGVGVRVVQRQLDHVQRFFSGDLAAAVDGLHRPVNNRECSQSEEVELDQAHRLDIVLVELGDHAAAAFFGIQRGEVGER